ncbi:unnamed protein product [Ambrosiozyma monospora]|uniref:Unnamed protein product n=1 Tax=Ambrosiozyma monospora TaxID=43982 RepID=A0ACB5TBF8_AMBMO|nr:unnamed protein product [Ambrosiozyma monospora]
MSEFGFSTMSGGTDLDDYDYSSDELEQLEGFGSSGYDSRAKSETPGNQLVVVVTKAQDLPNRRKLDKQSPYVVLRIQDQVQRTRVVPRGGQTPHFDEELWFVLDNVEETTLNINIYHQQKKDSELVCSGKVDFSTALKRSIKEGYDGWFDLEYNNRPAGRVYLEMTYYPSVTAVPIGVNSSVRDNKMKTLKNGGSEI